jgi:RNA polymerase sigma factor (TIGR02999 family)
VSFSDIEKDSNWPQDGSHIESATLHEVLESKALIAIGGENSLFTLSARVRRVFFLGRLSESLVNNAPRVTSTVPLGHRNRLELGWFVHSPPKDRVESVAMSEATRLLDAASAGDPRAAEELLPLVYEELRKLAASRLAEEKPGQTLQATALVHEAYLRLVGNEQPWNGRGHFFAAAAEAMRRILVDAARRKQSLKLGGNRQRVALSEVEPAAGAPDLDLLALDEALDRFVRTDPRKAELVKLRFFAGLTIEQAAAALGISTSTADNDWAYAKSWLRVALDGGPADPSC